MPHRVLASLLAMMFVIFGVARVAHADPKADIKSKVKEAMENYDLMSYDDAKKQLNAALAIAKKNHLEKDPVTARVHIALAIVEFSGVQDQDAARLSFQAAVNIDPKIQIDAAYRTPEMSKLLEQARSQAGKGGGSPVDTGGGDVDTGPAVDCKSVKGMDHTILENGVSGAPQPIELVLGSDVNGSAAKVSIMYRSEGSTDFTEVKMTKSQGCKYTGAIPAAGMKGSLLHYYVAAYDGSGKVIASKGSQGSPNIIELTAGKGGGGSAPVKGDEEDPLGNKPKPDTMITAPSTDDGGKGSADAGATVPRRGSRVTIAVVVGTGLGYVTGTTEGGSTVKNCCIGSSPLILTPELGYNISPATSISLAARIEFPLGANVVGHATLAPGVLLRLRHFLGGGPDGFRVMGQIGGGIIRNTIKLDGNPATGNTDIVAQGPLLLGGGIGYAKNISNSVAFVADLSLLAGIPVTSKVGTSVQNFGITGDLSIGLQVGF